ncbi:hypothetical protein N7532_009513 [Penicillium argentinense]|uniref:Uncharacterized protein n=1 Tax=Penicillium argentinense TaxID=1131581 RepID=A0A9W9EZE3_9EURO|nr:uncharacterized protein N7532_009513 [Penicillium argentinense]KAJ5090829.1 hypothetical protein N7532_009513 [Penicillium argentinense]
MGDGIHRAVVLWTQDHILTSKDIVQAPNQPERSSVDMVDVILEVRSDTPDVEKYPCELLHRDGVTGNRQWMPLRSTADHRNLSGIPNAMFFNVVWI